MKVHFGKRKNKKRPLNASLNLTALIDAFSILIIFMIFTMANGDYEPTEGMKLAEVAKAGEVSKTAIISVTATDYIFNNQKVSLAQLRNLVLSAKSSFIDKKAVVEADKETPYSQIQPVMALMSELEIETIQLAVSAEETL